MLSLLCITFGRSEMCKMKTTFFFGKTEDAKRYRFGILFLALQVDLTAPDLSRKN